MLLNGAVIVIGLVGSFIFGVFRQNISAGAYLQTLTLITGLPEVVIAIAKTVAFGLIAGLVGCYRGLTVGGSAKGVGIAVNETLVLCVVALFAVNVIYDDRCSVRNRALDGNDSTEDGDAVRSSRNSTRASGPRPR